jgi:hypothetical protein
MKQSASAPEAAMHEFAFPRPFGENAMDLS